MHLHNVFYGLVPFVEITRSTTGVGIPHHLQ
jgi:hypothetical protein